MNGKDLFLGMNYVNAKFVEEAETVSELKGKKKILSARRPVLIAAMIGLLLFLVGCGAAIYSLVAMRTEEIQTYPINGETLAGEEVHFEKTNDTFIELGAYYPQQIPEGYTITFITEGTPLQRQRIVYEKTAELYFDYEIMIGDPSSGVEVYDIHTKTEVDINGCNGILYVHGHDMQTLVWIEETQGYGFVLRTNDTDLDLVAVAKSTALGEPLTPTRSESTVKAIEELGDFTPTYLPEGFEEHGIMGCPLEEGGGWYSYVRKYYVNKADNTRIYFEYETYAIDTEAGYEDNARTICSFYIPGSNILDGVVIGEETEINGMFALVTGNHIAWADPERHVIYHLTSEDILDEELLKVARSITNSN